jgi:hypothetical protein
VPSQRPPEQHLRDGRRVLPHALVALVEPPVARGGICVSSSTPEGSADARCCVLALPCHRPALAPCATSSSPLLSLLRPHHRLGRGRSPTVHFHPTTVFPSPAAGRRPSAWRAATPFFPSRSPPPPSDVPPFRLGVTEVHMPTVDMGPSRRLAYAFVEPACSDAGSFIRLALEQRGGILPAVWPPPPMGP